MLSKTPQISVIIPNYNHSKYLKERIDSVLNQTYKDFEVIILDDCSTDNSRTIIEQFRKNKHVKHIIFNYTNSGSPFIQWEKGIKLSVGKYIWIAESDDYADLNFLAQVIKKFNTDEKTGIVYCDSNVIIDEKIFYDYYKKHRNMVFDTQRWNNDYLVSGKSEMYNYLLYECTINNTSSMVFKKDLVNPEVFDELRNFQYSGDWYFFLNIIFDCNIYYISRAMNYNRKGEDNFKDGVRSALNYFKERQLVRYLISHKLTLDSFLSQKLINRLTIEIKKQLVSTIINDCDFYEL